MKEHFQILAYSVFSLFLQKCIDIDIKWIARSWNSKADHTSKMSDHDAEGVPGDFFLFIDDIWEHIP